MTALAVLASGAGVLDRLQVLRSAPTPLRGAPAATWTRSPRTGVRQLRLAGTGLQPRLHDTTTRRTDRAGSTLATPDFGPKDGVHLPPLSTPTCNTAHINATRSLPLGEPPPPIARPTLGNCHQVTAAFYGRTRRVGGPQGAASETNERSCSGRGGAGRRKGLTTMSGTTNQAHRVASSLSGAATSRSGEIALGRLTAGRKSRHRLADHVGLRCFAISADHGSDTPNWCRSTIAFLDSTPSSTRAVGKCFRQPEVQDL